MSENSKIEWCDHTFNPWIGCTPVSPGCDHCYAAVSTPARAMHVQWGAGATRHRTAPSTWKDPIKWNARHAEFFAAHGRCQRVFCASLADVFDNAVDPMWRADLFDLIQATPNLDWLLLTKRIGNVREMVKEAHGDRLDIEHMGTSWLPDNVWVGATIVNQEEADRDIPKLLTTPARVRFVSMEPLLGPVTLCNLPIGSNHEALHFPRWHDRFDALRGPNRIDWVIVGGESGPAARPMLPDWARSLREQCASAAVPFLFKQWGEWTTGENTADRRTGIVKTVDWFAGQWVFGSTDLASESGHYDDEPDLYRIGKKTAGRHLDGRTHDEFPEAR